MHRQSSQPVEPVSHADHTLGSREALVTVIEYGDFECPKCKQAAGALKLLFARFYQRVRFVFRHFPVETIHPHALQAAHAAECAGAQGKFWEMHDQLFENQSRLEPAHLHEYARTLELDMARFTTEMKDQTYLQRVREHQRSGEDSSVRATPAFFVNGRIQDVSFGVQSLFEAVEETLRYEDRA